MIAKYLMLILGVVMVTWAIASSTVFASESCYGAGSTTREDAGSSISRRFQTFVAPSAPITGFTWNLYGEPLSTRFFHGNILETVGGVPDDGDIFPGSIVQIPVASAPDEPVGFGQFFDCGNMDSARAVSQTFVFASPLNLIPGVTYAMGVHETGTFGTGTWGYNTGVPAAVPGEGYFCNNITQPCGGLAGLNEFPGGSGINYDYHYTIYDEVIDINSTDGKIDTHVQNLREYLQLDGADGGLMFGLGVMTIVFAIGLMSQVPFLMVAVVNLLLVGIFSRAGIMPPWVILAVVAIAGVAVVFKLLGNSGGGGQNNEV